MKASSFTAKLFLLLDLAVWSAHLWERPP